LDYSTDRRTAQAVTAGNLWGRPQALCGKCRRGNCQHARHSRWRVPSGAPAGGFAEEMPMIFLH